jgi:chromosome segregation ATPase
MRSAARGACSFVSKWIRKKRKILWDCATNQTPVPTEVEGMTPVSGPVERLVKLIKDETRLDEKIRDAQAALILVRRRVSESLAQHYVSTREARIQMPEDLMKEEQSYERLLQALQDMKTEIAKQIRPVEEQIIQANVDHLRQSFNQESRKLSKCLEEIDENILACRQYLHDYERIRSSLHGLNEKLSQLGADGIQMPESLPSSDLGEIIRQRIDHLRSQGKI